MRVERRVKYIVYEGVGLMRLLLTYQDYDTALDECPRHSIEEVTRCHSRLQCMKRQILLNISYITNMSAYMGVHAYFMYVHECIYHSNKYA